MSKFSRRQFLVTSALALASWGSLGYARPYDLQNCEDLIFDPQGETLEERVRDYLDFLRRNNRITRNERTAWDVYDLVSEEQLVGINENRTILIMSTMKRKLVPQRGCKRENFFTFEISKFTPDSYALIALCSAP